MGNIMMKLSKPKWMLVVKWWVCLYLTGPTQDMNSLHEVEYFTLFFSDPSFIRIIEMHENAVTKIAEHPDQNKGVWVKPSPEEFKVFLVSVL